MMARPWLRRCGNAGDLDPNLKGLGTGPSMLGGGHSVTPEMVYIFDSEIKPKVIS